MSSLNIFGIEDSLRNHIQVAINAIDYGDDINKIRLQYRSVLSAAYNTLRDYELNETRFRGLLDTAYKQIAELRKNRPELPEKITNVWRVSGNVMRFEYMHPFPDYYTDVIKYVAATSYEDALEQFENSITSDKNPCVWYDIIVEGAYLRP